MNLKVVFDIYADTLGICRYIMRIKLSTERKYLSWGMLFLGRLQLLAKIFIDNDFCNNYAHTPV